MKRKRTSSNNNNNDNNSTSNSDVNSIINTLKRRNKSENKEEVWNSKVTVKPTKRICNKPPPTRSGIYEFTGIFVSAKNLDIKVDPNKPKKKAGNASSGKKSIITIMITDLTEAVKSLSKDDSLSENLFVGEDNKIRTDIILLPSSSKEEKKDGLVGKYNSSSSPSELEQKELDGSATAAVVSRIKKKRKKNIICSDYTTPRPEVSYATDTGDVNAFKVGELVSFSKYDIFDPKLKFGDVVNVYNACMTVYGGRSYTNCSGTKIIEAGEVREGEDYNTFFNRLNGLMTPHYNTSFTPWDGSDFKTHIFSFPSSKLGNRITDDTPNSWGCQIVVTKNSETFCAYELDLDVWQDSKIDNVKGFFKLFLTIYLDSLRQTGVTSMESINRLFQRNIIPFVGAVYPNRKKTELFTYEINEKANHYTSKSASLEDEDEYLFKYGGIVSSVLFNVQKFITQSGWKVTIDNAKKFITETLTCETSMNKNGEKIISLESELHAKNPLNNPTSGKRTVINVNEFEGDITQYLESPDWSAYILCISDFFSSKSIADGIKANIARKIKAGPKKADREPNSSRVKKIIDDEFNDFFYFIKEYKTLKKSSEHILWLIKTPKIN